MLPSSGRVRLNRNVIKVEGGGLATVPRRRRPGVFGRLADLNVGEIKREECTSLGLPNQDHSGEVTATVPSVLWSTKVESSTVQQPESFESRAIKEEKHAEDGALLAAVGSTAPGLSSVAACSDSDGLQSVRTRSERKGNNALSKRGSFKCEGQWSTGDNVEVKVEGPCTRSKCTSSLNGVTGKKGSCCSLQFELCYGGDSTNTKKTGPNEKHPRQVPNDLASDVSVKSRVRVNRASGKQKGIARASPLVKEEPVHTEGQSVCSPKTKRTRRQLYPCTAPSKLARKIKKEWNGQCEVQHIPSARGRRESKCSGQDDIPIVKRTLSPPHDISDIDRRANVSPNSLKPRLRDRSVRSCAPCEDIKYTPPHLRKVVQAEPERASIGPEQPRVRIKTRKTNSNIIKDPKNLVIWTNQYPKVMLCDIAKMCDGSLYCVLPAMLRTKVVHCFKRYFQSRAVLGPSCQGGERHGSEKVSCLNRKEPYHCTQYGKSSSQPQRIASTSPTASILLAGGANEAPTNCSASLSLGKRARRWVSGAGMLDRDVEEDPGAGSDIIAARGLKATEKWRAKRMRLGDGRGDASLAPKRELPSRHDSAVHSGVTTSASGSNGMGYVMSSDFQIGLNGGIDYSKSSDLLVRKHHGDTVEPEMVSCQRVMAYISRSCARTYISWPFPTFGPTSDCNGSSVNGGLIGGHVFSPVSLERTSVAPTRCLATDYTPRANQVSTQKCMKERNENDQRNGIEGQVKVEKEGALNGMERGGKERDTRCSLSPSRLSKGSLSFAVAKEPLSRPSQPVPDYLSSTEVQSANYTISTFSQGDADTVSTLSPPKDGGETDTTHSPDLTSTPSPVGLSDTGTAIASSPLLFCSTLRDMSLGADTTTSTTPIFPRNKNLSRGVDMINISSSTASSPTPKHLNEADATSNLTPSRDDSKTDTAYTLPPESSPPSPNCFLQSPESSFRSSESSLLLPQKEEEYKPTSIDQPPKLYVAQRLIDTLSYTAAAADDEEDDVEEEDKNVNDDEGVLVHASVNEKAGSEVQSAVGPKNDLLDEVTAYEQDILVLDGIQDDPELFGNLPQGRALNPRPTRRAAPPSASIMKHLPTRIDGPSCSIEKSSTTDATGIPGQRSVTFKVDENCGPSWSPVSSPNTSPVSRLIHSNSWPPTDRRPHEEKGQLDVNNNTVKPDPSERAQTIQTLNSLKNMLPPFMGVDSCGKALIKRPVDGGDLRQPTQKSIGYCRFYFSDDLRCNYRYCKFLHVPKEGDEKFCVEFVLRLVRLPGLMFLQKAVAVFTAYYRNNPPGAYFTPRVLTSLLSALHRAGLFLDILSVLNVSTAHKILASPEFLLVLFDYVRERSHRSLIPELLHLSFKMVNAGLPLNCGRVVHSLGFHQVPQVDVILPVCKNHRLPPSGTPTIKAMNLSHAILVVELCTRQEDWGRVGIVFLSVCHSRLSLNDLQLFSGQVAVVLLSETKDRLALPFAAFSKTVCQEQCGDGLTKSFLGRIGVSLMLRYYKTQQWAKGSRLVELLSRLKVNYSTLKGLFGNENGASRCRLVTMATELFLKSGSVEGALNTLRDNKWFLSSSAWPCEPGDAVERSSVLVQLAGKTSYRDTLDILSNLPGLKEPSDLADASQYCSLFNSHLGACVERQTLTVASDTLDFMLSKTLTVDPSLLHTLLHKLGKQNHWLRARAIFKHALGAGYYPDVSVRPGSPDLTVPCPLGEIEMVLAFEMFITVNAAAILSTTIASPNLNITLKRTQDSESEYLVAGSRLLSAAVIPKPKLTVRYTEVNSSQEQLFTLATPSAQQWLRHNSTWANEMWTHSF